MAASNASTRAPPSAKEIMSKAADRAFKGGIAGGMAMVAQVGSLMWLRTTMNYQLELSANDVLVIVFPLLQYRHGVSTRQAMAHLYKEGGIGRFYRGIGPALIQGPMSRFGDTAANAGAMAVLDSYDATRGLPVMAKTVVASAAAAGWRAFLMPVDTLKTTMQVEGKDGVRVLRNKVAANGPTVLWHGTLGAMSATFMGHYPWFATFNYLNAVLPTPEGAAAKLARNASIGFAASCVSDTISNSVRVLKTYKQTHTESKTYTQAFREVVAKDGIQGLMFRGLGTRLLANGLQGAMFNVIWRLASEKLNSPAEQR